MNKRCDINIDVYLTVINIYIKICILFHSISEDGVN